MQLRPPAPLFNLTDSDFAATAEQSEKRSKAALAAILGSVTTETATFRNVIEAIETDNHSSEYQLLALLQNASPDAGIRKAASQACQSIEQNSLAMIENEQLFALVDQVKQTVNEDDLTFEEKKLLDTMYRWFTDTGAKMEEDVRRRFHNISKRRIELRNAFMDNIASDPGGIWLTEKQLDGLSKAKYASLEADSEGKRRITLKRPDVNAVLRQCHNPETRKEVYIASESIFAKNIDIFREIVLLRDEAARLNGYSSFAAQSTRNRLVKTPAAVEKLLADLKEKLRPLAEREMGVLRQHVPDGAPLHFWDFDYYHQKMLRDKNVDHDLVSEYFPADYAVVQMMGVFQELFGLRIDEVMDKAQGETWHPDVKMFAVREAKDGSFLGYLYTDIYARPGKYNGAANFNIRASYVDENGNRDPVATSLICNLSPPSPERPSLLQHAELVTVFHELGHGIHDLVGRSKYITFHGHRAVKDFIEAPSQLLEYWCWTPQTLKRLSCHYSYLSEHYESSWRRHQSSADVKQQPPRQIPDELTESLIASKNVNAGILASRQVALALFDMKVHDPPTHASLEGMDIVGTYYSLLEELTGLAGLDNGSPLGNAHVITAHFVWGVEASYYSYLQTRIFAADIWKTCFRDDPMNAETARRYRKVILDKGGSGDEAAMLEELLGRPPSTQTPAQDGLVGAREQNVDGLFPAPRDGNLSDGAAELVLDAQVDAGALAQLLEDAGVAALEGLHDAVPAAVDLVGVGAPVEEHVEDLVDAGGALLATAQGLDDGQVLAGGVDVGAALLDEEGDDVAVALADGGGEGREDAAVAVLDGDAGREQQLDRLELVGDDGALHDALEGARLGQHGEDAAQHLGAADGHADGPVLAAHVGVGAAAQQLVDELDAAVADGAREGRAAVGRLVVRVDALVEQPAQRLGVVGRHGRLEDAAWRVEVGARGHERRQEVHAVVRDALEGRVLAGRHVGVGAAAQQQLEDVAAVVADRRAQRRVHAVLLGVGVDASVEQDPDRLDAVDARRQLHDARRLLVVGAVAQHQLEAGRVVGVGAAVEQAADDVRAPGRDGLEERRLALAVLAVRVRARAEEHVDERLRRLLVYRLDEERAAVRRRLPRVAAVHEQQVRETHVVGDGRHRQGRLRVGPARQVRVRAVLEQRHGRREERVLDGRDEGADAVAVDLVGVAAVQQEEAERLAVVRHDGLVHGVRARPRVGRDAPVQQLREQAVVLGADGADEGLVGVGLVRVHLASRAPAGHREGLALDVCDLAAVEVQELQARLGRLVKGAEGRHRRDSPSLALLRQLREVDVAVEGARDGRVRVSRQRAVLIYRRGMGKVAALAAQGRVVAQHGGPLHARMLCLLLGQGALRDAGQPQLVDVGLVRCRARRPRILGGDAAGSLASEICALEGRRQANVPDPQLALDLVGGDVPLEHVGAHLEVLANLDERRRELVEAAVAKHAPEAALHAAHGPLALVVELLLYDLVKRAELAQRHAELLIQYGDHVQGGGLALAHGVGEAGFDQEQHLASVEEVVGEHVEAVREVLDEGGVLGHLLCHAVGRRRRVAAELQALRVRLGRVRHGVAAAMTKERGCGDELVLDELLVRRPRQRPRVQRCVVVELLLLLLLLLLLMKLLLVKLLLVKLLLVKLLLMKLLLLVLLLLLLRWCWRRWHRLGQVRSVPGGHSGDAARRGRKWQTESLPQVKNRRLLGGNRGRRACRRGAI
ncbi:H/ACA ribonucleoprotein complex non-core subunit NAF1 [Purpureocillium lavendulum]|uniref:H/ACA ribonucleoprotein complex non-core subunit NAF1 n=1 Tax=Purpureocillium lavendulum TaxID=1247861 RepID=A0AB34G719_9HYPO|nr:H/ACA ribonucleoprotein complex non-core subunit NAF1 [Purpureocillium lavendulum]